MAEKEAVHDGSFLLGDSAPSESYSQDEEGNIYKFIHQQEEAEELPDDLSQEMREEVDNSMIPLKIPASVDLLPSSTSEAAESASIPVQPLHQTITTEQTRDHYNDPPSHNSPYTFRRFHSLSDVNAIIEKMQQTIGVAFVGVKKGKHFGMEENWVASQIDYDKKSTEDRNFRVSFSFSNPERSSLPFSQPFIPYDGVPFIGVSQLAMACEYKKMHKELLKCEKSKEYWSRNKSKESVMMTEVDEPPSKKQKMDSLFSDCDGLLLEPQSISDDKEEATKPKKRKNAPSVLPPGVQRYRESKKTNCSAVLTVKQVVRFPEYAIPTNMEMTPKFLRRLGKELREKLLDDPGDIVYEMAYYMRIPNSWAHSGHKIKVQHPTSISREYREKMLNYLLRLREREILSDIKFNVQGQKRQMKLHSPVLACAGVQIRNILIDQDYTSLANMLMPLNKCSLDAFFTFIYSGYLELHPDVDVSALETVFTAAGIKEGAQLCREQLTNPKGSSLHDWKLASQCTATQRKIKSANQAAVDVLNDILALFSQNQSENLKKIEQLMSSGVDKKDVMRTIINEKLQQVSPTVPSRSKACQTDFPAPEYKSEARKQENAYTNLKASSDSAKKIKVYVVKADKK